jgi:hypothetical protein
MTMYMDTFLLAAYVTGVCQTDALMLALLTLAASPPIFPTGACQPVTAHDLHAKWHVKHPSHQGVINTLLLTRIS